MSTPAFRCADAARERGDPPLGSSPQARRWLLLEHRGPWRMDAVAGSGIAADVLALVSTAVQEQQARPLLIRRPGRTDPATPLSWAVSYAEGVTTWGTWTTDEDLRGAVAALRRPEPPAGAGTDPLLLVCAHGLHDVCCALRGRPVAAALAAAWPEATWECSHVGGCRFAGNLVVLPDGVYYGALDADTAVTTVRGHLAGQVPVARVRGWARYPPPAQVAVAAVHERFGPLAAGDVVVTGLEHPAPGRWRVALRAPAAGVEGVTVTVSSWRRTPAQLTCRAALTTPATEYRVTGLT